MDKYMIVTPHTHEECIKLLKELHAMGYLHHFDWGCKSGEHCGWAVIEADDEAQAALVVPPLVRKKTRVIKLTKFEDEDVKSLHTSG